LAEWHLQELADARRKMEELQAT
jgi:hypothetical protein